MAPEQTVMATPAANQENDQPSIIKSFVHRRQASKGEALVPAPQSAEIQHVIPDDGSAGRVGRFVKNDPGALGELQKNQQEPAPRLHGQPRDVRQENARSRSRSPTKSILSNPFKSADTPSKSRDTSPTKSKKTKSTSNFAGLLSRPKSLKGIAKLVAEEEERMAKDKENRTPAASPTESYQPPIFAQFTSDASVRQQQRSSIDSGRGSGSRDTGTNARPPVRGRPQSIQAPGSAPSGTGPQSPRKDKTPTEHRGRALDALSGRGHSRAKSAAPASFAPDAEPKLDLENVDIHLEAMLDRRNIPENQRYKMRNLSDTIKMEFIRQDWAEMKTAKLERRDTAESAGSKKGGCTATDGSTNSGSDAEAERPKHTRGRSFTFTRGKKERSPSKKPKGEGTLGRHFRSKSTESVVLDRPRSSASNSPSSPGNNLLAKFKLHQGPGDYVAYLRKVQSPELVEVGKLHKLRLLLRNETVAWIEDFMDQGGMAEIVGLLNRIMDVEWREEHEDALLHENLACLKALSTTASGMEYLSSIQGDLFPKLLHMLFDPERKGPSEFTTRTIITSVLLAYVGSAPPSERAARARQMAQHLRDPEPKENERPLPFVSEMHKERPYREWTKEVVSVTKEVFWIFLHNLNVVTLASGGRAYDEYGLPCPGATGDGMADGYMQRHFPHERPPVPAAPYVGGVEWDATNYLASHLDLMNAILACTPTASERNALRGQLRVSGWERCMGASLRLCKEKFYGAVHDGLRTWVAAAAEDGWEVKDVRFGPPPPPPASSAKHSPKKGGAGGGQGKSGQGAAPKLEVPRLDFELGDGASRSAGGAGDGDGWDL